MDEKTATRYRVTVAEDVCIGSGSCIAAAPTFFDWGDDHAARARAELVAPDEAILDCAECCPVGAITVTDEATGRTLAP
ncbi:ferredoxin [Streptomyces sp. 3MP-14]|uniref:Ferredoxin n=1 Tax=Streptomyces mimosae TaxID=2586635 RepID=A0A5N6AGG7_9ACTN|nr:MULTISPECIES: ferredoxin [Streptomyces]KAB8167957.1 ferredoxin [Streptomyces mimosae]KAB8177396.1 ferredoxin [Streptomyces sp. 3MP-14]